MAYDKMILHLDLQSILGNSSRMDVILETFGTLDPDARSVADAYRQAHRELMLEIEKRGFSAQPLTSRFSLTRDKLPEFVKVFSFSRHQEMNTKYGDHDSAQLQYLEQNDRVLAQLFQANYLARDNLGRYCDSRLESQG